jgi:Xaa-Pro dipeptidase
VLSGNKCIVSLTLFRGEIEELKRNFISALFFPHGVGHLIGLDVHDVGGYPAGTKRIDEPGIKYLRMRRTLKAGMVVTVEPGVYFVDAILDKAVADPKINRFFNLEVLARFRANVGGVRIEDDIVILKDGIDNLTGWIAKDVADFQSVMTKHC